jgi:hypothetical protein
LHAFPRGCPLLGAAHITGAAASHVCAPDHDKYPLYRLPQAELFKGEKVITGDDGLKPSSEAENIVQNVHIENTLEGVNCIKVTTETSSTRGQQGGSKIDAYEMKENKGHNDGEALERSGRLGQPTAASVCAVVNFSRYEQL